MAKILTRSWWAVALGGVASVLFGLLVFRWPGLALVALITLFGAFVLLDGIFAIITAIEGAQHHESWVWPLLGGAVSVAAGLVTFIWPSITALALLYVIAFWAIVRGATEIVTAIHLRRDLANEWLLIGAGALAVLFGLILLVRPGAGALAVIWLIGTYAVIGGIMRIGLAFRLRSLQHALAAVKAGK
jgi:uncharacterized membrane protein HdeD (DUF308 family)